MDKSTPDYCEWTEDDDGDWTTDCGQMFAFLTEHGPAENGMKFCCYCGKPLVDVRYVPPVEDDDE